MFSALSKNDKDHPASSESFTAGVKLGSVGEKSYILDHISNSLLKRSYSKRKLSRILVEDHTYNSNEGFWRNTLGRVRFQIKNVVLDSFQIVDWFPRSPGLAFTKYGLDQQNKAQTFIDEQDPIVFLPDGKIRMINGGIGSYRFNPIIWQGNEYALCTATTDHLCHTGVPLAIPTDIFEHVDTNRNYQIKGEYVPIPAYLGPFFNHLIYVPKFYLRVEELIELGREYIPVYITPAVFMRTNAGESIASYCTCNAESRQEHERAAEWLQEYAYKYNAQIITDYDQQISYFENAEFSLSRVMNDEYDIQALSEFGFTQSQISVIERRFRRLTVNINNENKGNQNIAIGSQVNGPMIAGGQFQNCFNNITTSTKTDEIKLLLTQLVENVEIMTKHMDNKTEVETVKQDLDTFVKEATKDEPRKNHLEVNIESIKKAAENIHDIGGPVLDIVGKLLPLLLLIAR